MMTKKAEKAKKQARLRQALRDNLKRRKQQPHAPQAIKNMENDPQEPEPRATEKA